MTEKTCNRIIEGNEDQQHDLSDHLIQFHHSIQERRQMK